MENKKKETLMPQLNFFNQENMKDQTISEALERPNESFPNQKLKYHELNFMTNRVGEKMLKYKNNQCYKYLEKYHLHLENVLNAKNKEKMLEDYSNSLKYVQYFSLCWDEHNNINKDTLSKM